MIEVTNLTKRYGDQTAVDHLSFRVEKGQIYGFLGPNGAGKSTTMNIITGYLAATEGTVVIDGRDIRKEPEEAKKKVGYLPEIPPLYMDMTVEEYLLFASELKKVPKKDRKEQTQKAMELTGIADKSRRLIKNLSKGYRQRVGLAQAILGNPEVLILDEPSVGLDPKQIIEMRELIRKLGEDHTVILSSHILSEVSAICDHIMIIAHGKLVASDSPEGLQKLMEGSRELELTVKGEYESVRTILEKVDGVEAAEQESFGEKGCAKLKVTCREDADVREAVFYALAEAKLPILEMTLRTRSLEDIFLELTEHAEPEKKDCRRPLFPRKKKLEEEGSDEQVKTSGAEETEGGRSEKAGKPDGKAQEGGVLAESAGSDAQTEPDAPPAGSENPDEVSENEKEGEVQ